MDNVHNISKRYKELIDKNLKLYIPDFESPEKKIYEAMKYSLMAGGKRIRPILTLAVNELFDGEVNEAVPFACAIEIIHTYSLIHDDLPSMDNDDYRRGRLTNHKVFGEGIAVLAGDALLNRAFEIMISTLENENNLNRKIKTIREIVNSSGTSGMIGGQVVDIESQGKEIDADTLKHMHDKKTGSLITASAAVGGLIAGASEEDINRIRAYGSNLGLAFQIKDDILSETGKQDKLGKKVGNDREMNKATYVTILGLNEAEGLLASTTQEALESIEYYGTKAEFLINLANYLIKREN